MEFIIRIVSSSNIVNLKLLHLFFSKCVLTKCKIGDHHFFPPRKWSFCYSSKNTWNTWRMVVYWMRYMCFVMN